MPEQKKSKMPHESQFAFRKDCEIVNTRRPQRRDYVDTGQCGHKTMSHHNLDYARLQTEKFVDIWASVRGAHIPIHLVAMAGLSETFCACVVRNQKTMFASQREMESIYIDWYCVIDSANIDDGSDENTNNIHLTSHILIQRNALHMDVRVCVCVCG